jgi:hypothetical protein
VRGGGLGKLNPGETGTTPRTDCWPSAPTTGVGVDRRLGTKVMTIALRSRARELRCRGGDEAMSLEIAQRLDQLISR